MSSRPNILIAKITGTILHTDTQKRTFHRGNYWRLDGLGVREWMEKNGAVFSRSSEKQIASLTDMLLN
jgi:hypothetical protein